MSVSGNRLNAIRLVTGQTKRIAVSIRTREGRPGQLTGATMRMSICRDTGSAVILSKTTGNGIEIVDPAKGDAVITLSATDTAQLATGTYRYDVWVEFEGTPPIRFPVVTYAELIVEDSVTRFV